MSDVPLVVDLSQESKERLGMTKKSRDAKTEKKDTRPLLERFMYMNSRWYISVLLSSAALCGVVGLGIGEVYPVATNAFSGLLGILSLYEGTGIMNRFISSWSLRDGSLVEFVLDGRNISDLFHTLFCGFAIVSVCMGLGSAVASKTLANGATASKIAGTMAVMFSALSVLKAFSESVGRRSWKKSMVKLVSGVVPAVMMITVIGYGVYMENYKVISKVVILLGAISRLSIWLQGDESSSVRMLRMKEDIPIWLTIALAVNVLVAGFVILYPKCKEPGFVDLKNPMTTMTVDRDLPLTIARLFVQQ